MPQLSRLWRHTDNDGDAQTDDGIEAALRIGAGLSADYAVAVSTGAQRATQTLACLMTAGPGCTFPDPARECAAGPR